MVGYYPLLASHAASVNVLIVGVPVPTILNEFGFMSLFLYGVQNTDILNCN